MFNKSEIMKRAWVWAKQDLWSARAKQSKLRAYFVAALKRAWAEAKAYAAQKASTPTLPTRPIAVIEADLFAFECKDTMRGSDWQHLDALRAELSQARAA